MLNNYVNIERKMIFPTARNFWVQDKQCVGLCSVFACHRCPVLEGTERGVQPENRAKSRYERNSSTTYEPNRT